MFGVLGGAPSDAQKQLDFIQQQVGPAGLDEDQPIAETTFKDIVNAIKQLVDKHVRSGAKKAIASAPLAPASSKKAPPADASRQKYLRDPRG